MLPIILAFGPFPVPMRTSHFRSRARRCADFEIFYQLCSHVIATLRTTNSSMTFSIKW